MNPKCNTILVVEDEDMLLQAIAKKLTNEGFNPVTATSAEQALDYLKSGKIKPDLIWLDYHLTGMDGLAFMQELKKIDNLKTIPIMVVSNSASDEKVKNLLALGAEKYLLKAEHRLDDIVATAKELCQKS